MKPRIERMICECYQQKDSLKNIDDVRMEEMMKRSHEGSDGRKTSSVS